MKKGCNEGRKWWLLMAVVLSVSYPPPWTPQVHSELPQPKIWFQEYQRLTNLSLPQDSLQGCPLLQDTMHAQLVWLHQQGEGFRVQSYAAQEWRG